MEHVHTSSPRVVFEAVDSTDLPLEEREMLHIANLATGLRPTPGKGSVTVLIATFNGEKYLEEQLHSLESQTWPRIDLVVSDDGSMDGTLGKLDGFVRTWDRGTATVIQRQHSGFAENFRSLMTLDGIEGDYVAYCDQDDIWEPDKLRKAIDWLDSQDPDVPALYCGRTRAFPSMQDKALSPLFTRPPSFRNALVQSIAGANTMVMNRAAFDVVCEATRRTGFVSHDWWTYLIVTGIGGKVYYCPEPDVHYRQHDDNLVGANNTWRARFLRLRFMLAGRFKDWSDKNISSLEACRDMLTTHAQECLDEFCDARRGNTISRLYHLKKSGVYRQTMKGQLGLVLACILGLI